MVASRKCALPKKKVKKILSFFKLISNLNNSNRKIALQYVNDEGLEYICESVFNILYNPDCTSNLSKNKKIKLIKTLKPKSANYQRIGTKKYPLSSKRVKIIQSGSGLSLLLSTAIPFLASLLMPKS